MIVLTSREYLMEMINVCFLRILFFAAILPASQSENMNAIIKPNVAHPNIPRNAINAKPSPAIKTGISKQINIANNPMGNPMAIDNHPPLFTILF